VSASVLGSPAQQDGGLSREGHGARRGDRLGGRRSLLAGAARLGALGGVAIPGCAFSLPGSGPGPAGGVAVAPVAYPERSLTYAPLLLAVGQGPFAPSGAGGTAPLLRSGGRQVAAAVASGAAVVGALPLPDLVAAAQEGAPLVAIGALTRRAGGQLVVAPDAPLPRRTEAFLGGEWRGARMGVTTESGGSEALVRFWWLARLGSGLPVDGARAAGTADGGAQGPAGYLGRDPWRGEPRWIGFSTAEGLVAALKDGRVWAFAGPSTAAAQAVLLGAGEVLANVSDGSAAQEASVALPVVLAARRERVQGGDPLLGAIAGACARAGAALCGPDGGNLAARALPERDPLALRQAWALDVPQGEDSLPAFFSADGRLPPEAVGRYLDLAARAGAALTLDAATLLAG
jgi:ABC-type nitrate/sulfonate/bicarbonate transport system substrate-binding protein